VRELVEQIATDHGLEPDWLNDAAKGFLPGNDDHPVTVFESEYLLVQVPSAKYLLAMKLHASRDERDLGDGATLWLRLGYTTAQQGIDLLTATTRPHNCYPGTASSSTMLPNGPTSDAPPPTPTRPVRLNSGRR
jgi:hypothetical protein